MITTHAFHGTGQHLLLNKNNIETSTDVIIYLSGKFASITLFHLGDITNSIQVMPVKDETVKAYKLTCYQCNNLRISGQGRMEISGTTLEARAAMLVLPASMKCSTYATVSKYDRNTVRRLATMSVTFTAMVCAP